MADCEKIRELMMLQIDNEISEQDKSVFEEHMSSCESCKREFDSLAMMISEINALEEIELPDNFHEESMEKIKQIKKKFFNINNLRQYSNVAAVFLLTFVLIASATVGLDLLFTDKSKNMQKPEPEAKNFSVMGYDNGEELAGTIQVPDVDLSMPSPTSVPDYTGSERITEEFDMQDNMKSSETSGASTFGINPAAVEAVPMAAQGVELQMPMAKKKLSVEGYGTEEKNVKSYTISITVDDVTEAVQSVNGLGGRAIKSNINRYSENNTYADISIAVEDAQFYSTVNALKSLGEVMLEAQGQYSVLTDAKDAYARYIVKLEERNRLMELLAKTETVDNMLFVENRLNQIINEMESYKTQIDNYNAISNLPVIEIRLVERGKPKDTEPEDEVSFGSMVASAFGVSVDSTVFVSQLFMLLLAYIWLPILLVAICAVVVLWVRKRLRR